MSTIRAVVVISSAAISGAAGCAQPGTVEVNPINPTMVAQDAGMVAQDAGMVAAQDAGMVVAQDASMVVQDAGLAAQDAGPRALPPCPSGWMCDDPAAPLAAMGISDGTVTDADGKPVSAACGNGGQVTCDPKNPKMSCPELSAPFCAHVAIPSLFVDLYSCAQLCTR